MSERGMSPRSAPTPAATASDPPITWEIWKRFRITPQQQWTPRQLDKRQKTWAIVPIKAFSEAKTRLRPVLTGNQRADLARYMAMDVVAAMQAAREVHGITLLGEQSVARELASELNCDFLADSSGAGLSANLDAAARRLHNAGVDRLVVVPGDLPMLRSDDIDRLLRSHSDGLIVCPADRDGGTNALVVSPPTAIRFCYGSQSAERHLEAARAANLASEQVMLEAFHRDIDTPDDLVWYCGHSTTGHTAGYLSKTGICETLRENNKATFV